MIRSLLRPHSSRRASLLRQRMTTAAAPFRVPLGERPRDHRKCVGIVLLNARNQVWQGRRADGSRLVGDSGNSALWQLPQGGVDKGEENLAAACRELREETGVRSVTLLGELPCWLCYQFPPALLAQWRSAGRGWGGKYVGQAQRWYVFRYTGSDDGEVDLLAHGPQHPPEFDAWRWAELDAGVVEGVVPFKARVYAAVVARARELAGLPQDPRLAAYDTE